MSGPICHIDMDAFFAAVEVRANPRIQGLPILVGGGPEGRGVVTTASYPARVFGIRSGMSMREALARCPDAVLLPVDPAKYISASSALIRIFESFTPAVEPASIDEVFLDLSGRNIDWAEAVELARSIKHTVLSREHLTCSIGIGSNKLQAKMATGLDKPDGLTCLRPGDFQRIFWPRPVSDLWGVGPESTAALAQVNIRSIEELAHASERILASLFGVSGRVLIRMAHGEGGGAVVPYYDGVAARSMGHETTLSRDEADTAVLERHLLLLCDKLARRLRREEYAGHIVTLKLRWSDRSAITRQTALARPTDEEPLILAHARRLLRAHHGGRPVRLIGVNVGHLVRRQTLFHLFPRDRRQRELVLAKDRIRDRFGEGILMPAGVLRLMKP